MCFFFILKNFYWKKMHRLTSQIMSECASLTSYIYKSCCIKVTQPCCSSEYSSIHTTPQNINTATLLIHVLPFLCYVSWQKYKVHFSWKIWSLLSIWRDLFLSLYKIYSICFNRSSMVCIIEQYTYIHKSPWLTDPPFESVWH